MAMYCPAKAMLANPAGHAMQANAATLLTPVILPARHRNNKA
jgi:hypothetical protein